MASQVHVNLSGMGHRDNSCFCTRDQRDRCDWTGSKQFLSSLCGFVLVKRGFLKWADFFCLHFFVSEQKKMFLFPLTLVCGIVASILQ
mmetsp:Transcript_78719/g.132027  ORF Transcript_78719/g.132027 Transcript_78719/m.132027 type:complete len:88 (-) Transcript_78719:2-265(-)